MAEIISTTGNKINWDSILSNLGSGHKRDVKAIWDNQTSLQGSPMYKAYLDIANKWIAAGYRIEDIFWYDYYPEEDYDTEIDETFRSIVGADFLRSWISRIDPGRNAPIHWDVDDNAPKWQEQGKIVRYTCWIDKPRWGSAFIIEDDMFYDIEQGTIVQWDSWDSYHAGTVAGKDPQYLYHYVGLKEN